MVLLVRLWGRVGGVREGNSKTRVGKQGGAHVWGLRDERTGGRRRVLGRKEGGVVGVEIVERISGSGGLIWGPEE